MTDQTITLSYEERSTLLSILAIVDPTIRAKYPEYQETLRAIALRISRLECQPGGCPHCNADAAREESERRDDEDDRNWTLENVGQPDERWVHTPKE